MRRIILIAVTLLLALPSIVNAQGCMEASSDGGAQIVGYIQPQFKYDFLGDNAAGNSLDQNSFYFNYRN